MNAACSRILLAEDEPILRVSLSEALRKEGWTVDAAEDGQRAIALFEEHLHGIVLTDLVMPRLDGLELLQRVKKLSPGTTVLVMTAYATIESAVETMRGGAADFIVKPFTISQLFARLGAVCSFRQLQEQNRQLQAQLETRYSFAKMIGKCKEMRDVFELIQLVADSDANVLIQGESGTGKEMVAAAFLADLSQEQGKPAASLDDAVLELFDTYAWPGNVRELRNVVERALLLCRDGRVGVEALPPALRVKGGGRRVMGDEVVTLHEAIERAEVEAIRIALAATSGRRAEAAELLGVSRKTLWERCKHLGLGGDD